MNLEEYFKEEPTGPANQGSKGIQSDWLDFCHFVLIGPKVLVVDANFVPSPDDGLVIELPPGRYHVQVRAIDYSGDKRVARLRAVLEGCAPSIGRQLGETWTDTALTGICDLQTFTNAWGPDDEASYERIRPALE